MPPLLQHLLDYVALALPALVVITNPITAATYLISIAAGMPERERKKVVKKACLTSLWVMIAFAVGGTLIFRIFNVTIGAFQIAGGIILFAVGMEIRRGAEETVKHKGVSREDISVVPLAIPMIAGPGAITTVLMLSGEAKNIGMLALLTVCILISIVIMYFVLLYSSKLTMLLKEEGIRIAARLMGLIVAVVAVQFVLNGIKDVLPIIIPIAARCLK